MNENALFGRLDRIIVLLEEAGKKPSLWIRLFNGLATGAGIMGIFSAIEVIKSWIGG